jgi:TonB family protein
MRLLRIITVFLAASTAIAAADQPRSTDIGSGKPPEQGQVFKVGGPISPPRAKSTPDPQYSKEGRRAHVQGMVVLWMVVGVDGRAHDITVARSLGHGLDEQAVKAVQKWRFEPAKRKGKPVPVQINVEVKFRL